MPAAPSYPQHQLWPGWFRDQQLAAEYAQQLSAQLGAAVNATLLAQEWLDEYGQVAKAARGQKKRRRQQQPPPQKRKRPAPRQFLNAAGVTAAIYAVLASLLASLWAAAWALGWASAIAVLGIGTLDADARALKALLREGKRRIGWILQTRLSRLERALVAAARDGSTVDELAQQISDILGSLGSALLATQSETTWASGAAAYAAYQQAGVKWVRWQSRNDGLVCPRCLGNQKASPVRLGQRFPSGDLHPLAHPRCFPAGVLVSGPKPVAATTRKYKGDIVTVILADGKELPATPNHPVLTPDGWVAAGNLREGGEVLCASQGNRPFGMPCPDDGKAVARIEDVAHSLTEAGAMATGRMPVSPEDFHGDGSGDNYVDIVWSARHAVGDLVPQAEHEVSEGDLIGTENPPCLCGRDQGSFASAYLAGPASGMGGAEHGLTLLGTGTPPSQLHCLRPVAAVDASSAQHAIHHTPVKPVLESDSLDRGSIKVVRDQPIRRGSSASGGTDASLSKVAVNAAGRDSMLTGQQGGRRAFGVFLDEFGRKMNFPPSASLLPQRIVGVRRVSCWVGHVYNLETVDGWFVANGIIVHNCRCSLLPGGPPKIPPRGS